MPILFDDDEEAYLAWIAANPDGHVVNIDRRRQMPGYPMTHLATHELISSERIGNFTTGDYIKICSRDVRKLEYFCEREFGRTPSKCRTCF